MNNENDTFPRVAGACPACGSAGALFLASGGHVTCSVDICPNPGAVDDLLTPSKAEGAANKIVDYLWSARLSQNVDDFEAVFQSAQANGHGVRVSQTNDYTSVAVEDAALPAGEIVWER